jgi:GNAT superfamily N-acetyltransferase
MNRILKAPFHLLVERPTSGSTGQPSHTSDSDTGHIADVVVAPAAGGRGVGSALMRYAEDWGRKRGFAMLTLNVFTANHRARIDCGCPGRRCECRAR